MNRALAAKFQRAIVQRAEMAAANYVPSKPKPSHQEIALMVKGFYVEQAQAAERRYHLRQRLRSHF